MKLPSPTRINTFVVIITFNPDNRLYDSLKIVKNIFDNIIIVDNNSASDIQTQIENPQIIIIKNSDNLGIAHALNRGALYALGKGAEWILMLDQDSIIRVDILEIFKTIYLLYPSKDHIGQIGVSFPYLFTVSRPYSKVNVLITSGTLLSLSAFLDVGLFREDFFIDSVDFEYSLRLKQKKYVNLLSPELAIDHKLGDLKCKKILFISIKSTNHSPLRRYYMARNHVLISKKYFSTFPLWIMKKNLFMILIILQMILVDDQKVSKIKNTWRGLIDGILYKTNV